MAKPGITPGAGRKPTTRKISQRSAVTHIAGKEQPYPTYRFSNRAFLEKPNHNPFSES